jgi:hypothetical protein
MIAENKTTTIDPARISKDAMIIKASNSIELKEGSVIVVTPNAWKGGE